MVFENLAGKQLGQYELRELLGMGGMGAVYRGFQVSLKREVAVKVLSPQLTQQPNYVTRFTREAETSAKLEHQHIVPIYDYGTHEGVAFVVMRLLDGGTLGDRLNQHIVHGKPLPSLGETAAVLMQIASALEYAHARGVIHRDIKPSNIMFDVHGNAYVVDFGIAKLMYATSSMTGTGATLGTPVYMAPEQWRAEELTGAADQYALGVMAYALVTGAVPFDAPTPHALMYKHLHEAPTPAHTRSPDVPETVAQVIGQALQKEPSARFASPLAFATAFDDAARGYTGKKTGFFSMPVTRPTEIVTPPGPTAPPGATPSPAAMMQQLSTPAAGPLPPVSAPALPPASTLPRGRQRRGYGWLTLAVIVIVLVAAIGAFALLSGRSDDDGGDTGAGDQGAQFTPTPTVTQETHIVLLPTATETTTLLATHTPADTATAIPTATPSLTVTPSPTPTASVTATSSSTPDWDATAGAMIQAALTATAEMWTATPTPDIAATAEALVIERLTQTAEAWTDTPTPTATWTPSRTPTRTPYPTPTPFPTWTPYRSPTPFPTFTRVPPTHTRVPTSPPRPTNTPVPYLHVGGRARVYVEDEGLKLRSGPGTNYQILENLPRGTIVWLVGEPISAQGYRWWQVRSPNGVVGYAVERADGINTLIPLPD